MGHGVHAPSIFCCVFSLPPAHRPSSLSLLPSFKSLLPYFIWDRLSDSAVPFLSPGQDIYPLFPPRACQATAFFPSCRNTLTLCLYVTHFCLKHSWLGFQTLELLPSLFGTGCLLGAHSWITCMALPGMPPFLRQASPPVAATPDCPATSLCPTPFMPLLSALADFFSPSCSGNL